MTRIPEPLRRQVIDRAHGYCEYCRISLRDSFLAFEIDHIIAEKHRGETADWNLCYCCFDCNHHKGTDISSIDIETGALTRLFNPRTDQWSDHIRLDGARIEPLTAIGRVTVFLLDMNDADRASHRQLLIKDNSYPCS
jgi:HNH endonuclease